MARWETLSYGGLGALLSQASPLGVEVGGPKTSKEKKQPGLGLIAARNEKDSDMQWKNQELKTIGELADALCALETREEAEAFMNLVRKDNPENADAIVGNIIAYFEDETALKLMDWCEPGKTMAEGNAP